MILSGNCLISGAWAVREDLKATPQILGQVHGPEDVIVKPNQSDIIRLGGNYAVSPRNHGPHPGATVAFTTHWTRDTRRWTQVLLLLSCRPGLRLLQAEDGYLPTIFFTGFRVRNAAPSPSQSARHLHNYRGQTDQGLGRVMRRSGTETCCVC